MKPVTIWSRNCRDDKGKPIPGQFEHNHIEDGHVESDKPDSKFDGQKFWANETWKKEFGWLDEKNALVRP